MEKVLSGGPEAADRLEAQAAAAINAEKWDRARQLLRWRLEMRYPLEQKGEERREDRVSVGTVVGHARHRSGAAIEDLKTHTQAPKDGIA